MTMAHWTCYGCPEPTGNKTSKRMFIPIHDSNELRHIRFQYVTVGLIVANAIIFFLTTVGASEADPVRAALGLGYIPAVINDFAICRRPTIWFRKTGPTSPTHFCTAISSIWA